MNEIVWAVIAWVFLNVVVKLFVNSLERLYKGKIDELVKKAPGAVKQFLAQVIRYILVLFFAPLLLLSVLIPQKYRGSYVISDIYFLREFLLKKDFSKRSAFLFYLMSHPHVLFFTKDLREHHSKYLSK